MSTVTIAQARALIDTPLSDPDLQILIDRAEGEITSSLGAFWASGQTITEALAGGLPNLYLKRPIASVTSVTEYSSLVDTTGQALTQDSDYVIWTGQGRLQRMSSGSRWGAKVTVIYTPRNDNTLWAQAVIDLISLMIHTMPLAAESVGGEYSYQAPENYEARKQQILNRIRFRAL